MSTDFSTKCDILSEVHIESGWNKDLADFADYNDVGLPLAWLMSTYLIKELEESGVNHIEETWSGLCELLAVDPDTKYQNSDHMIRISKENIDKKINLEEEEEDKF